MQPGAGSRSARFEIIGDLGGTLETHVVLPLRNAGPGGVLADSPVPLTVGAQMRIKLHCDGIQAPAQVVVRHVQRTTLSTGEQRYLVGFEFVSQGPVVQEILERWMLLHGEASA